MKTGTTYITAFALAFMVLFNACSVEKRHYRPGFHVGGNGKAKTEAKKSEAPKHESVKIEKQATAVVPTTASAANNTPTAVIATPAQTKAAERVVTTPTTTKAETKLPGSKHVVVNSVLKNAMKGASPEATMADKIISILLCIFLGWIGIHRFYLGYPISAIIMILLFVLSGLGGFLTINFLAYIAGLVLFVWVIVDLIFLILDKPLFFPS
jgi:TM2 domain-containing membrane protein YozV